MRYALCKTGEVEIFQIMEVPENFIKECTPNGFIAYPIGQDILDATHIIVDGQPVRKRQE